MTQPTQLALVFPGQGSQAVGMLSAWRGDRVVEDTIAQAGEVLGRDLWQSMLHGPPAELANTLNTQPVMVASSVALYRAWQARCEHAPSWAAGHSVGEISALTAAGMLDLSDALRLVRLRAQAMMTAVPNGGGMAAVIGLEDGAVQTLCERCAEDAVLEPVNYNAPGQVVVAGHLSAIERLKSAAKAAGAKMVMTLPVSGPFHSRLMQPAAQSMAEHLATLQGCAAKFRVLHNATLDIATPASMRIALAQHLVRPVPWTQTLQRFADAGVSHFLEVGQGEVLTNLGRRVLPALRHFSLQTPAAMDAALESCFALHE